ncbi:MAG: ribosomal RNA small subunit methyltransferase A [Prochlorococcus sp. SP3034]|nr:ribosomal RNA small subunit methyltransferase A [Prochlorococcus sp. SP3034]|tara:strand:- start:9200 stop:10033 length:834 start_codon:yes stop_codon:yes gene_type:complete
MNLKKYYTKKRFGQHWLINKKVLEKIIKIADPNRNDIILEIGPGRGALTSKLLESNIRRLHAIELDKDLIQLLNNKFSGIESFSLEEGDILNTDINSYNFKFTKIIANIPYNITSPLIDKFVGRLGKIQDYNLEKIVFMMQKDVADRIVANECTSYTGALSTKIKLISKVEKICDVKPSSFSPPPKVYSSLVVFKPYPIQLRLDKELEKCIDKLLKVAFNGRRKKLKNTLCSLFTKEEFDNLKFSSKINFDMRPQDVSIDNWKIIAKCCTNIEKSRK